jgi:nitrate reductase gamma subunit
MTILTYLVAYCGTAILIVAVAIRILMWSRMPMHVRWELYPVAHEGAKASYGGSYLEESEWWTRPRHFSLWGEVSAMVPEILFLVALKEHNPKLWSRSFPFHFGLYLVAGCTILMAVAGVLVAWLPGIMAGPVGTMIRALIPVIGHAGLVLGLVGAAGLLQRRRQRPLRDYSAPMDTVNLVFFVAVFALALVTAVTVDRRFAAVSELVSNLVTFNVAPLSGAGAEVVMPSASAILLAMLAAYIPLTHMSHFVGKYFAYHAIRWADEPNLPGGSQEKVIEGLLNQPVSWSAPHIRGDGTKTWLDVATEDPER